MLYQLTHTTLYEYQSVVNSCHNLGVLKPRTNADQELIDFQLDIEPEPQNISSKRDFFGNYQHDFSIQTPHTKLSITAKSIVDRNVSAETQSEQVKAASQYTFQQLSSHLHLLDAEMLDAKQYLYASPLIRKHNQALREYTLESFAPNRSLYQSTHEFMSRIFHDFKFDPSFTTVNTPIDTVFEARKGVCQDFAHVAIAGLRSIGIPTRYISGYIETLPPEGQEKLIGTDASHAWFSIYIPQHGWFEFDPTNNQIPENQYIQLAFGRDYSDIVPLKGVIYSSGENRMSVSVDLRKIL
jgi:transglutaminase-like putative cysteine protease